MKYYKDDSGEVFAYEDNVTDEKYFKGKTKITKKEADKIVNPPKTKEQKIEDEAYAAYDTISKTMLYYIRELETGEPMPEDIKQQRVSAWSKLDLSLLK